MPGISVLEQLARVQRLANQQPERERFRQEFVDDSFDPEGDAYDVVVERMLNSQNPLPLDTKPNRWQRTFPFAQNPDEVFVPGANQSWVWHQDEQRYLPHSGTVTNRIDLLGEDFENAVREKWPDKEVFLMLKGRRHPSWDDGVAGERDRGATIELGPRNRYFSVK